MILRFKNQVKLKWILFFLAGFGALLPFIWPHDETISNALIPQDFVDQKDIQEAVNLNLYFSNETGKSFHIAAMQGTQTKNMQISLVKTEIQVWQNDKQMLSLKAESGIYVKDKNQVRLYPHVYVQTIDGYKFEVAEVRVDLKAGKIEGIGGVQGVGPQGKIQADGFVVYENGNRVIFTGNPKVLLQGMNHVGV